MKYFGYEPDRGMGRIWYIFNDMPNYQRVPNMTDYNNGDDFDTLGVLESALDGREHLGRPINIEAYGTSKGIHNKTKQKHRAIKHKNIVNEEGKVGGDKLGFGDVGMNEVSYIADKYSLEDEVIDGISFKTITRDDHYAVLKRYFYRVYGVDIGVLIERSKEGVFDAKLQLYRIKSAETILSTGIDTVREQMHNQRVWFAIKVKEYNIELDKLRAKDRGESKVYKKYKREIKEDYTLKELTTLINRVTRRCARIRKELESNVVKAKSNATPEERNEIRAYNLRQNIDDVIHDRLRLDPHDERVILLNRHEALEDELKKLKATQKVVNYVLDAIDEDQLDDIVKYHSDEYKEALEHDSLDILLSGVNEDTLEDYLVQKVESITENKVSKGLITEVDNENNELVDNGNVVDEESSDGINEEDYVFDYDYMDVNDAEYDIEITKKDDDIAMVKNVMQHMNILNIPLINKVESG